MAPIAALCAAIVGAAPCAAIVGAALCAAIAGAGAHAVFPHGFRPRCISGHRGRAWRDAQAR